MPFGLHNAAATFLAVSPDKVESIVKYPLPANVKQLQFRTCLESYNFSVITDHSSLKLVNCLSNPLGRLVGWAMELQECSFDVIHRKGRFNVMADALSRLPSSQESEAALAGLEVTSTQDS
jgi:hypothetical protein